MTRVLCTLNSFTHTHSSQTLENMMLSHFMRPINMFVVLFVVLESSGRCQTGSRVCGGIFSQGESHVLQAWVNML